MRIDTTFKDVDQPDWVRSDRSMVPRIALDRTTVPEIVRVPVSVVKTSHERAVETKRKSQSIPESFLIIEVGCRSAFVIDREIVHGCARS